MFFKLSQVKCLKELWGGKDIISSCQFLFWIYIIEKNRDKCYTACFVEVNIHTHKVYLWTAPR